MHSVLALSPIVVKNAPQNKVLRGVDVLCVLLDCSVILQGDSLAGQTIPSVFVPDIL